MRRTHTNTIIQRSEGHLFYGALFVLFSLFLLYMYFISSSVMHVVMLKEVDSEIASMGTSMSELEASYIELQHNMSSDIATHRGFVVADKKVFINKSAQTLVLSTR